MKVPENANHCIVTTNSSCRETGTGEGRTGEGHEKSGSQGDGNVLYGDCGGGFPGIYICQNSNAML